MNTQDKAVIHDQIELLESFFKEKTGLTCDGFTDDMEYDDSKEEFCVVDRDIQEVNFQIGICQHISVGVGDLSLSGEEIWQKEQERLRQIDESAQEIIKSFGKLSPSEIPSYRQDKFRLVGFRNGENVEDDFDSAILEFNGEHVNLESWEDLDKLRKNGVVTDI